jgi:sugar/nucleoside kinase (ribokinase family)
MMDVVCTALPFLDLHIAGLDRLPNLGEELTGTDLRLTPGGSATIAIGCARLGLRTAICAPLPDDELGRVLADLIEHSGVEWTGPSGGRCPVSVTVPVGSDRTMITYHPGGRPGATSGQRNQTRAWIADLEEFEGADRTCRTYAVVGHEDALALGSRWRGAAASVTAVIANRAEARSLTGHDVPAQAALTLAEAARTAVVTLGGDGCVAASAGELIAVPAHAVAVGDTTGAGDLFTAAYVWADLAGLPLRAALEHASLYAALALESGTPADAAPTLDRLLAEARRRGLAQPPTLGLEESIR